MLGQARVTDLTFGVGFHHGVAHEFIGVWIIGSDKDYTDGLQSIVAEFYPSIAIHFCPHCSAVDIAAIGDPIDHIEGKQSSRLTDYNWRSCPGYSFNITASPDEFLND